MVDRRGGRGQDRIFYQDPSGCPRSISTAFSSTSCCAGSRPAARQSARRGPPSGCRGRPSTRRAPPSSRADWPAWRRGSADHGAAHLKRNAYLYVRQSTPRRVLENSQSTARQYALPQRATALGWPEEQIVVIDSDLGQSGSSAVDRAGFQKLVAEVSLGHAGLVLGLEVSRLARNSTDWHRLLELCACADTLILDEDGIYNPARFNDRLLLGLKGTMSEAEWHMLQARMQGGWLNKVRRGQLALPLPIGFLYDAGSRVILDPDQPVQQSIRLLFETFRRLGSAIAVVNQRCAASAATPCACATTLTADNSSPTTNATVTPASAANRPVR